MLTGYSLRIMCDTCQGKKQLTCAKCKGTGLHEYLDEPCDECWDEGSQECPDCAGDGFVLIPEDV